MRRIYESRALHRDTDDPFVPKSQEDTSRSTIDWSAASHALMPVALRKWAIELSIETEKRTYERNDPVIFRVTMRNRLPFPVAVRTTSPILWKWMIDDIPGASRVHDDPPDRNGLLSFGRSEKKTFQRQWHQRIRESRDEWSVVNRGEYILSACINTEDTLRLAAETTIEIV